MLGIRIGIGIEIEIEIGVVVPVPTGSVYCGQCSAFCRLKGSRTEVVMR